MTLATRGFNPIWALFNLTGKIFDDTYYMYVLENTIPYIPSSEVWHDPEMNVVWSNPIQFLANGTLPVDIFFLSEQVYRLEFRKNNGIDMPSQADPLIYEVNDYVPGQGSVGPIDDVGIISSNQITNSQFALFNYTSAYTLTGSTNPDPIEIGPGWFLVLGGTGNVTIERLALNSASNNVTNAPYALRLTLSGWNSGEVYLRQRFQQNGMLWSGKFVTSAIMTRIPAPGVSQSISAVLVDSMGAPLGTVLNPTLVVNTFTQFTDHSAIIPVSTNTDVPPDAYIEYRLLLPSTVTIDVTSFQLINEDVELDLNFEQDSIERQIDHSFHYYKPKLEYKPIPSYLVGWDFPLNPAQLGSTQPATAIGANKSKYVWDQTIIFQSADSGVGVTRGTAGQLLLTAAATTKMAVIQYLGPTEARKILNAPICVNISAKASVATLATVSLWYTTDVTLPVMTAGTNNSLVAAIDANGLPSSFNGTWTEVPKLVGPKQITIGLNATTNFNDYPLFGWDMSGIAACNTATFFAIVVGTASITAAGTISFNSISLQAGGIPTRPSPQALNEVLFECQYYFQKSFLPGTTPASAVGLQTGETYGVQTKGAGVSGQGPFYSFPTQMRASPTITKYNPFAAGDQIYNISTPGSWSASGLSASSAGSLAFFGTSNGGSSVGDLIAIHWTADARLGII